MKDSPKKIIKLSAIYIIGIVVILYGLYSFFSQGTQEIMSESFYIMFGGLVVTTVGSIYGHSKIAGPGTPRGIEVKKEAITKKQQGSKNRLEEIRKMQEEENKKLEELIKSEEELKKQLEKSRKDETEEIERERKDAERHLKETAKLAQDQGNSIKNTNKDSNKPKEETKGKVVTKILICSDCGEENKYQAKFCDNCGKKLRP